MNWTIKAYQTSRFFEYFYVGFAFDEEGHPVASTPHCGNADDAKKVLRESVARFLPGEELGFYEGVRYV